VEGFRHRGLDARALALPVGAGEKAVPSFLAVATPLAVIGGISFGGRVASLAAAETEVAALLCISYPLAHQPEARTAHWPRINCPALMVNGERDELTETRELERRLPLLRGGRLALIPGGQHSLIPFLDRVLDLAVDFLAAL
jgi:predicted alpha/beta-hydrolase family hydrolase